MVPQAPTSPSSPTLPARPPTPPRASSNGEKGAEFFGCGFVKDTSSQINPDSSVEAPSQSSGASRKKVEWSAWTDYKDPPILSTNGEATLYHAFQPLPSSAERKPVKSILKPYNGATVQNLSLESNKKLSPPHTFSDLATMLESVAQQLAMKDRSSRMDAYMTLSGVLKASENVPDMKALKDKMGLLLQFIQRDLTAKTASGTLDTALIINALTLLSSFLYKPAIANTIPNDFSIFVVEHAIKAFGDPGASKDITKHLMFILAQQNFSARIMNMDRVTRLITRLHEIEENVKGKSIIIGRLNIYRTLLRQSKSHMLTNLKWIQDLFIDMLSSLKEIRAAAITFGLESSLVLGVESKVSRAVMDFFQWEQEQSDARFADYYGGRLKWMIRMKQDSATVPQIWSVPLLYLRCRPRQFDQWAFMKPWLEIISECFNCSDRQTKIEANIAWNRLVFAVRLDERTTSSMVKMLCQPLSAQLKRKDFQKLATVNTARRATLGSVCNLLYYSFKPNSNSAQLDLYWDEYALQLIGKDLIPVDVAKDPDLLRQDLVDACLILSGLFDLITPRVWKETRAVELSDLNPVEAKELPALDPKWLRKNASRVFAILDPLLERLYWDFDGEAANVSILWRNYIKSITFAAVKEIKVSNDTMACVACIFNFLYKVWHSGPRNLKSLPASEVPSSENFLRSFERMISTTIEGLGLFPFTEKLLSVGNQDTFTVIATPSQRPTKSRGEVKCPLHHLFLLLTDVSPNLDYDGNFSRMVRTILFPFFSGRGSSKGRIELANDLLKLLPINATQPCHMIWQILADFAAIATDTRDESSGETSVSNGQPLGVDYRTILKILEVGIDLSPSEALSGWKTLFNSLVTSATIDAGDGGRAIAIIEPLARDLLARRTGPDNSSDYFGLSYSTMLLSTATYPKDRQALDAARRRLWGTASAGPRISGFDPYSSLYQYTSRCLEEAYKSFTEGKSLEYLDMLLAIDDFLDRCPPPIVANVLEKLQHGISCWVQDETLNFCPGSALSQKINSLWLKFCPLIQQVAQLSGHSKTLTELEPLICSGLESKHRSVVNSAIQLWNSTFGNCEEHLECPPKTKDALLRLRPVADLRLPFTKESLESAGVVDQRQPPSFPETQEDPSYHFGSKSLDSFLKKKRNPHLDPSPLPKLRQSIPQVVIEVGKSISNKRSNETTPEPGRKQCRDRNSMPKLRHDDSQAQFEAIESSPFAETTFDSQLLTDRQKEVKDRQKVETAALFPDIRSSPRSKGKLPQKKANLIEDLSLHLSAQASPTSSATHAERQTTPTIVPAADYDDFVTSSPTPTRAIYEDEILSDPPSSPPEVIALEHTTDYMNSDDDWDVASSPPEMIQDAENHTTTPYPSAQIDPYAVENNHQDSTSESNSREQGNAVSPNTSAPLQPPGFEVNSGISSSEACCDPLAITSDQDKVVGIRKDRPCSPLYEQSSVTPLQQTPITPVEVFVDALSSPASSNKHPPNEVFEDAVSSPQHNLHNPADEQASPPLGDLNDSSILRLITEFDDNARLPEIHISSDQEKDHLERGPSADTEHPIKELKLTSVPGNASQVNPAPNKKPLTDIEDVDPNEGSLSGFQELKESSNTSCLIPETPGMKVLNTEQTVDDEEIDPDDTIVVETPDDFEEAYRAPSAKKTTPRKRNSTKLRVTVESLSRKRKHDDEAEKDIEVPDSQISKVAGSPKKGSPAKKRRIQPKRSSQGQLQNNATADPEPAESFSSVHLDTLMQDSDDIGSSSTNAIRPSTGEQNEDEGASQAQANGEIASGEEPAPTADFGKEGPRNSDIEDVVEETIHGGDLEGESSSVPIDLESDSVEEVDAKSNSELVAITSASPTKVSCHLPDSSPIQSDVEVMAAQAIIGKLQSLVGDLREASLSREEVASLEDLFMDAKEQLYGAGRRGRQRVES